MGLVVGIFTSWQLTLVIISLTPILAGTTGWWIVIDNSNVDTNEMKFVVDMSYWSKHANFKSTIHNLLTHHLPMDFLIFHPLISKRFQENWIVLKKYTHVALDARLHNLVGSFYDKELPEYLKGKKKTTGKIKPNF